ncbi:F-box only protein 7-like isoform X2 [Corticium candelabrum]|uniref:F-box only protein 7-like isoform X2 n=1 Tax=Corticium candelabrum TaxID=121492 RepID=UPI002E26C199|nr:F-box only protein 7-like isoform X2 [Corticium candelabrum]
MKVRVRSKGTTVVVDLPQDASLSDLTSSIRQPPTGLLIEEEVDFRLSLNGKNPLQEDGRTRLCDIGIVTGDLVHILIDSNSSSTNPSLKPSVKPHPQNEFPQSDQSNKQATKDIRPLQQAVTAHDACIEHNMTTKNHQETDVPLLSLLYSVADVSTLNEAIVVALHSFMLECGFRCSPNMELICMPDGWKQQGLHKMAYRHPLCMSTTCCLTCVSLGPCLVVHGTVATIQNAMIQIKPSDFIRGDATLKSDNVYHNLSSLAEKFKRAVAYQLIASIKQESGIIDRASLLGLPAEIQLYLLRFLDMTSLVRCSGVCRELNVLACDQELWRKLYKVTFGKRQDDTIVNWKKEFKCHYVQNRAKQQRYPLSHERYHHLPSLYPQPPFRYPPDIVGGDYDRDLFPLRQPSPFALPSDRRQQYLPHPVLHPRPRFDPFGPLPEHQYDFNSRGNRRRPGAGGWGGNTFL